MGGKLAMEILCSAERAAMIALSVHEHLVRQNDATLAREVWVVYLETSRSAEKIGVAMGVEVLSD
jgi:hypothetical protein